MAAPRIRLLFPAACALAVAAVLAAPRPVTRAEAWEEDFNQKIASTDSNIQHLAVKSLDPSLPKGRAYLFAVLDKHSWYLRKGAIDVLAGASGDALDTLVKEMKSNKS